LQHLALSVSKMHKFAKIAAQVEMVDPAREDLITDYLASLKLRSVRRPTAVFQVEALELLYNATFSMPRWTPLQKQRNWTMVRCSMAMP